VQPIGNKAALLSAFSGMSMGTLATFTLFILTFFDRSLATPFQFGKQVGLNLLGTINRLKSRKYINIDNLFTANDDDKEANFFKESLRKIRHDVEVSGAQSFLFTSLREQEGKSFLAASLAYNLAMKNKKVLIIDTNFKNNTLTHLSAKQLVNNFVTEGNESSVAATRLDLDISLPTVDILGNKGGKNSPSELLSGVDFGKTVRELGKKYDFIFLEASCLTKYSDARELVDYVDKVIAVFDSNTVVSATDENSLAFLKGLNEKLLGCILNKVELKNLN
jgi:Mrp family chromosome partitioning ATPase